MRTYTLIPYYPAILVLIITLLTGCSTSQNSTSPFYSWTKNVENTYQYEKSQNPQLDDDLMRDYHSAMKDEKQFASVLPSGVLANLAYKLILGGHTYEAIKLLEKEIKYYPEEKTYVEKLIKIAEDKQAETQADGESN